MIIYWGSSYCLANTVLFLIINNQNTVVSLIFIRIVILKFKNYVK